MEISIQERSIKVAANDIDFVRLLSHDMRVKEVAKELLLPVRTAEARASKLKLKYGVESNHGLVALFFRHNLIN